MVIPEPITAIKTALTPFRAGICGTSAIIRHCHRNGYEVPNNPMIRGRLCRYPWGDDTAEFSYIVVLRSSKRLHGDMSRNQNTNLSQEAIDEWKIFQAFGREFLRALQGSEKFEYQAKVKLTRQIGEHKIKNFPPSSKPGGGAYTFGQQQVEEIM